MLSNVVLAGIILLTLGIGDKTVTLVVGALLIILGLLKILY